MIIDLPMTEPPSLQFGITIRAWSLVFAADAHVSTKEALQAMDLIALRCRQGTLRVHIPRAKRRANLAETKTLDPFRAGIAGIPLELLLSFRENIIDSALWDAEKKHVKCVEETHDKYNTPRPGASDSVPFANCLHHAALGEPDALCDACTMYVWAPQIDYGAIDSLLATYSLSLASSPRTPLLTTPPYAPNEPHPWVIALATHHTHSMSRSPSFLPVHTPSPVSLTTEISFFAPSFMRITSSDIMRFRKLVRTWRLTVVEVAGPVAARGSESMAVGKSRSGSGTVLPGAIVDIEAMDLVQSIPCEPRWMLLNPNRHAG